MPRRIFEVTADSLSRIHAFADLTHEERVEIARLCKGLNYRGDETIVTHQDPARDVYFLHAGSVRVTIFAPSGREVTFRDQGPGEMFGELWAIDGEPRSAHVLALSDSSVIVVSGDAFVRMLARYESLGRFTQRRLAELVRSLSVRVYELSALAVRSRVHAELLRLARASSEDGHTAILRPAPKHQEIASRIGTSREAVAREMKGLERKQVVERRQGAIVVHSMDALVEFLAGSG